jgi:oxalate decarboxylase/phosphoglucose isomerase-like protein (cupin superfamily)
MVQSAQGSITTEKDVEQLVFDWGKIHFLSDEKVTGSKSISFGAAVLEPGKSHMRHNHPDADEIIYFISGEIEQMIDDQPPIKCTGGSCVWIPKAVFHSTTNIGSVPVMLVVAYVPAGAEEGLRQIPGMKIIPAGQH